MMPSRDDPGDIDINGIGPLVRDPRKPSPRTRWRHRVLLDLLLGCRTANAIAEARKIVAAYFYLQPEYEPKIAKAVLKMREVNDAEPRRPRSRARMIRAAFKTSIPRQDENSVRLPVAADVQHWA
jgi:hypothetical protein